MIHLEVTLKEVKYMLIKYMPNTNKYSADITFKDGSRKYIANPSMEELEELIINSIEDKEYSDV